MWEWFVALMCGDLGDGLLVFLPNYPKMCGLEWNILLKWMVFAGISNPGLINYGL